MTSASRTADPLLTVAEVAQRLGTWKDSGERFPRRLIAERRIEFVRIGRHVRIRESVVEAYIDSGTVLPLTRRTRRLRTAV
ncbi:excisionase family DNA-binding protein [Streptacidiphilus sp. PB12-B1b]|uniref:excisionase family DNA-binding protein n=1 Tax=Streptacidiphilus sp. PB12-B1b TaxID=2705012 RepID=UPI0015F8EC28|nr:excisionase family DNA-binding protein [Streptacidiphilus sp. PB12-B1b]QMU79812.1 excisionase family DNA-binding protein [Streptacidiphilus sp. PB12-B1b]